MCRSWNRVVKPTRLKGNQPGVESQSNICREFTARHRHKRSNNRFRCYLPLSVLLLLCGCGGDGGGGFLGSRVSLDAEATSISTILLSWSKPSGGLSVSGYGIAQVDEHSSWTIGSTSERSYLVTGLEPGTEYCFFIRAPIVANALSKTQCATTFADRQAPSTPVGLMAEALTPASVRLSWQRSTDEAGVAGYNVFRDDGFVSTNQLPNFQDSEAYPEQRYCYRVSAYDQSGNESARSGEACAETPSDLEDPSIPAGITAQFSRVGGLATILVSWEESTDDGTVQVYEVFRDGEHIGDANESSYPDTSLQPETTYCYAVRAVDRAGKASEPSAEVCVWSSWLLTRLDHQYVYTSDIAMDADGDPHLSFKTNDPNTVTGDYEASLHYQAFEMGVRQASQLLEQGLNTGVNGLYLSALTVDVSETAHIVHMHSREFGEASIDHLIVGSNGVEDRQTVVDNGFSLGSISVVADSAGILHFCAGLDGRIVYGANRGGSWNVVDADTLVGGVEGSNCDIAVDADGAVHISYTNSNTYDLMYLSDASGDWLLDMVDPKGPTPIVADFNTSIAIDRQGHVHIAYFHDYANYQVEYATNATGSWQTMTIDSEGDVGYYTDLAVDAAGHAHVVYKKFGEVDSIMYGTNRSGVWTIGALMEAGWGDMAIAVDDTGNAHVVVSGDTEQWQTYLTNRE
jgi:hypothetical protein